MAGIKYVQCNFVGTPGITFDGKIGDVPICRSVKQKWHNHFFRQVLLAILLCIVCAVPVMAAELQLPAIVEPASQERHVGKLIFVQLVTPDIAATKKFYAGLFGWTFRDFQDGGTKYAQAFLDGRPIAGLIHKDIPPA